ncbi:MAG: ATP-binding protein [Syntrophobacterales bacterium]|jgi:signal transduction histidine kinase|nr:MAG: ATP-binding protein [Syntrophobacterales bacterium]
MSVLPNAVGATPDGGEIEIRSRVEGDRLRLTVLDCGPGIPEEDLKKIFEPLYTTRPAGLGLGPTISRAIIERLGGTLSARNESGRGAAFTIELPISQERLHDRDVDRHRSASMQWPDRFCHWREATAPKASVNAV